MDCSNGIVQGTIDGSSVDFAWILTRNRCSSPER